MSDKERAEFDELTDFDKKILRHIWLNASDKIHDPHDKIRYEHDENEEFAWWEKLERIGLIEATGSYKWRCIVDHYGAFIFDTEKYIAELEAEVVRLKAGRGWQPIETAPKDGTLILVSFGAKGVRAVSWEDDLWCVDDDKHGPYPLRGYSYSTFTAPTHWMPLPAKPSEAMKGGER